MGEEETRRKLAELIVQALEVGTAKREWDVVDDIFAAFGESFAQVESAHLSVGGQRATLPAAAAERLAKAAPSAAALLNELVRCGGRFVSMVEEVYARLARHAVTTAGTSEEIRLRRADVAEENLTLSPAFVEEVRQLQRRVQTVWVGRIDEEALAEFIRADNGELYGTWPLGAADGRRLADAVLNLNWLAPAGQTEQHTPALSSARQAAERLVSASESVIRAYHNHLDLLGQLDPTNLQGQLFSSTPDQWRQRNFADELRWFQNHGAIGTTAVGGVVSTIEEVALVGLDRDLRPVVLPMEEHVNGTGLGQLAGFAAMWHEGMWAARPQPDLTELLGDDVELAEWLEWVTDASRDATRWLAEEVVVPLGEVDLTRLVEVVEQFLNLPLWKQRSLLYEVWVLCATLDAAEDAGWEVELSGLTATAGVWTLSVGPAPHPVARLRRGEPAVVLDVWREPERETATGILTPDIAVTTTGDLSRVLLVVEAKDRHQMPAGLVPAGKARRTAESALWVARRYATALRPGVTWVCNHCDFQDSPVAAANHGDPWTRIHLAARFRPGDVPAAFADSVRIALTPPGWTPPATRLPLTVVLDLTGSMAGVLDDICSALRRLPGRPVLGPFRGVLYTDHGPREPFLVRELGPFEDVVALLDAVASQPLGHGDDVEEALEDALRQCGELVAGIGPHLVLIITDAPAHSPDACPHRIDMAAEVERILGAGATLCVATDYVTDPAWQAFTGRPNFHTAALRELLELLAGVRAG